MTIRALLLALLAASPALAADKDRGHAEVLPTDRDFWAFRPLAKVDVPALENDGWSRTPIDKFVLAKLRERGLAPPPAAPDRALARRAAFDLVGLPPEPGECEAFAADASEDKWPRLIDRLLADPHFGERQARHWLDVARFAESHGYEHDTDRPYAYVYRDFLVRAFDADMPWDQLTRWQIAGDEFAPGDSEALAATGFLAAGPHATQITKSQVEKERYDELDDMTRTTSSAFLGLSVGCARCHDHKFDPIPSRDYYSMLSVFTTTVRSEIDVAIDKDDATKLQRMMIASEGLPPLRIHSQGEDFFPETWLLKRGDVHQKQEVAQPGFLRVLMRDADASRWIETPPPGARTSWRRRALANWMCDVRCGAGALLARVAVNRLWQHHFGRGIVATPNDFGAKGEPPTHPELLEWLASALIENGWRLKPLHRLIMDSAVYRAGRADADALDPANALLARRPARRVEAEVVRDALLAVSGRLDATMFGPSASGPDVVRRSLYLTVKRSQLVPSLQLFDAPDALQSLPARATTTVAPQALFLLNSPQVEACAAALAGLCAGDAPRDPVTALWRRALQREPEPEEKALAERFLAAQAGEYAEHGRSDAAAAALADLAQSVFTLNEFVYVD